MKSAIFWDITPCSLLKVNRRFGRTCRNHLQGRRISRARNQSESRWQAEFLISRWFLARLILRLLRWRPFVPLKRWLTFKGLHGVIFQKMVLTILVLSSDLRLHLSSGPGFDYNSVWISSLSHVCYMACLGGHGFDYPNKIWRWVQAMKLLITQLFISLCYLFPLAPCECTFEAPYLQMLYFSILLHSYLIICMYNYRLRCNLIFMCT
jgi:hypothetical protein